jgi:integrase
MAKIELKGITRVTAKGRMYYYAWRGGPRLKGEPGSPEFVASYNEAIEHHRAPDNGRFHALVVLYKSSPDFKKLAPSTRKNWGRWLDRIADHFGSLSIAQFDRPEKIRKHIRQWRGKWASTPRTADYGMQVLSRVLSYAVDPLAKIASNPCEGVKQLYSNNRSEIIWTDADITAIKKVCSPEIAWAIDLAATCGLRQSDLLNLSWPHIGEDAIVLATGKSRGRKEAIIPLYDDLRAVLSTIKKRSPRVLTNSSYRPWTQNGFMSAISRAKKKAGIVGLTFNDLRGTAATRFYIAGLTVREIAEVMAWEEEHVERIIRRYVGRNAATKAMLAKLNKKGT